MIDEKASKEPTFPDNLNQKPVNSPRFDYLSPDSECSPYQGATESKGSKYSITSCLGFQK